MALDTITREEFDKRLEQSIARTRQKRFALEAQAAELEALIGRYASVLEQLEAEDTAEEDMLSQQRDDLRHILTELAERTSAVAAAL